jgi:hypothetical protein
MVAVVLEADILIGFERASFMPAVRVDPAATNGVASLVFPPFRLCLSPTLDMSAE